MKLTGPRLDGLTVKLPPLRERREDVLPLFSHLLAKAGSGPAPAFESDFAERLCIRCHGPDFVPSRQWSRDQWNAAIDFMSGNGNPNATRPRDRRRRLAPGSIAAAEAEHLQPARRHFEGSDEGPTREQLRRQSSTDRLEVHPLHIA